MKSNIAIISGVKKVNVDVAKGLAGALDMFVLDTDDYIAYEMELDLNQIISDYGSGFFYEVESKKLATLCDYENAVIATSPTCLVDIANIEKLSEFSYIVLLECDPAVEWQRFHRDTSLVMRSPLMQRYESVLNVKQVIVERNLADCIVDITDLKPNEIVAKIEDWLAEKFNI